MGPDTDGQVLVFQDLLGLQRDFKPKFLKTFVDGFHLLTNGIETYIHEVKNGIISNGAMNTVTHLNDWQALRKTLNHQSIGFIPTMGNLHEGHLSLCEKSKRENDVTVVSIFVNPAQFNQATDFAHYPRTLAEDLKKLAVDYILLPTESEIYPDQYQLQVNETQLSLELEGEYRPVILPDVNRRSKIIKFGTKDFRAYFGEKDYQQLLLVKKMVSALFIPTEIIGCETIRAADGLALSSEIHGSPQNSA